MNLAVESWNARQVQNHKFIVGDGTMFDCVTYISWTQFQNECNYLHNWAPKNMFITSFLFKPPHLLEMLVKSCSYRLQKSSTQTMLLEAILYLISQLT